MPVTDTMSQAASHHKSHKKNHKLLHAMSSLILMTIQEKNSSFWIILQNYYKKN